jgi:hypothetical protein
MRGIIALMVFATLTGCSGKGAETSASTSSSGSPAAVATVPVVIGNAANRLSEILAASDLTVGQTTQVESDLPAGTITWQLPAAGSSVPAGTPVSVGVSTSQPPKSVASAGDRFVCLGVKEFLSNEDLVGILKDARDDEFGYLTDIVDGFLLNRFSAAFQREYETRSDLSPAIKSPLGQLVTSFVLIRYGEVGNPLQADVDPSAARGILDSTKAIKSACKTLGAK